MTTTFKSIVVALAVLGVLGFGTYAFSGWGMGYGGGYGDDCGRGYGADKGRGMHHGGGYGWRHGYGKDGGFGGCPYGLAKRGGPAANLDEETVNKLDAERKAFFEETEDLRRSVYEKELALQSELVKEDTNIETASAIQKEISNLRAELDQKRLDHRIKMKQIAPEAGAGFGKFRCRGGGFK